MSGVEVYRHNPVAEKALGLAGVAAGMELSQTAEHSYHKPLAVVATKLDQTAGKVPFTMMNLEPTVKGQRTHAEASSYYEPQATTADFAIGLGLPIIGGVLAGIAVRRIHKQLFVRRQVKSMRRFFDEWTDSTNKLSENT